jgi:deoxyribodipyrimidine photo-lyase
MMILYHFPKTVNEPARDLKIKWRNSSQDFKKWAEGKTGYPVVDAGMRQLNATGFMHNRARMITASFLTKHLLIHWKEGERYFAEKLLDYELSSNVGNWQWVAGTGYDAAPYFRIFNPTIQAKKFDPDGKYAEKWIPEWGSDDYPKPMIEHEEARRRAFAHFPKTKKRGGQ